MCRIPNKSESLAQTQGSSSAPMEITAIMSIDYRTTRTLSTISFTLQQMIEGKELMYNHPTLILFSSPVNILFLLVFEIRSIYASKRSQG